MATRFSTTVSVSDLQHDAGSILEEIGASNQPAAVVRDDQATAVLMSISAWEKAEKERDLLQRLAKGEAEIAAGAGFDLDEVLAEADRILHPRSA